MMTRIYLGFLGFIWNLLEFIGIFWNLFGIYWIYFGFSGFIKFIGDF
jgi:hypothetical protein